MSRPPDVERIHVAFVVDEGVYPYQAYHLARSLIEFGGLTPGQLSAHLIHGADVDAGPLASLGIRVRTIEPFGHAYCNRIGQLGPLRRETEADWYVLLDTDMFATSEIATPSRPTLAGKIVDAPNPPLEILERVFTEAGQILVPAQADVVPGPTAHANLNAGCLMIPGPLLATVEASWTRWARWCMDRAALFGRWQIHIDQVSLALAVAEADLPVDYLPREANVPTHKRPRPLDARPGLLHYHRATDRDFLLMPTGEPTVDGAVEEANAAIRRWRGTSFPYRAFWQATYALPGGEEAADDQLQWKRAIVERAIALVRPDSVVDIGCGSGRLLEGLADSLEVRGVDVAGRARQAYLRRVPHADFEQADISEAPVGPADLALCVDVIDDLCERDRYRAAIRNAIASGASATLITGAEAWDGQAPRPRYYHGGLGRELEAAGNAVVLPLDLGAGAAYLVVKTPTIVPADGPEPMVSPRAVGASSDANPGGTVTVLIPAYSSDARLTETLRSLAAQSYGDLLVHVSFDLANDYEIPDHSHILGDRLRVTQQARRLGWVGNVNALLASVESPYFVVLSHDDALTPTYIETAAAILAREPTVVVAHGGVRYHGVARDGEVQESTSNAGGRLERLLGLISGGLHLAMGFRGVMRSSLLETGLRLRTGRWDGHFSNDLYSLEAAMYGESRSMPGEYVDKYTDQGGLSREFHRRTADEKSQMLADNYACLFEAMSDAGLPHPERSIVAARYALWLMNLGRNWSIVPVEAGPRRVPVGQAVPALGRFASHVGRSTEVLRRDRDAGNRPGRQADGPALDDEVPAKTLVLLPSRGLDPRLEATLESLAIQTSDDFVVWILHDGAGGPIPRELGASLGTRLRVVPADVGSRPLTTPFHVVLEPGDAPSPGFLAAAVEILSTDPDAAAAFGANELAELGPDGAQPWQRLDAIVQALDGGIADLRVLARTSSVGRAAVSARVRHQHVAARVEYLLHLAANGPLLAMPDSHEVSPSTLAPLRGLGGRPLPARLTVLANGLASVFRVLEGASLDEGQRDQLGAAYAEWLLRLEVGWGADQVQPTADHTYWQARRGIASFMGGLGLALSLDGESPGRPGDPLP